MNEEVRPGQVPGLLAGQVVRAVGVEVESYNNGQLELFKSLTLRLERGPSLTIRASYSDGEVFLAVDVAD